MIKIAICDDETDFLKYMSTTIKTYNPFDGNFTLSAFQSGVCLLQSQNEKFDLIFLDIQMPELGGIDTAKFLRKQGNEAVLVFITAISIPSTEAFKVSPFRYLVKSKEGDILNNELSEIFEEVRKRYHTLSIRTTNGLCEIRLSDILYLTINHKSVEIITDHSTYCTKEKMLDLGRKLAPFGFAFSHKSYLVNLNRVFSVQKLTLIMENQSVVPISQPKAANFKRAFTEYAERRAGVIT